MNKIKNPHGEPKLFALENLTSQTVKETTPEEINTYQRPEGLIEKEEYRRWCKSPETKHCFYSTIEGEHPGLRVSKENPPTKIHGLIADFDAEITDALLEQSLSTCPKDGRPTHVSKSFSGGAHYVWQFEEPLNYGSAEHYKAFVAVFIKKFCLKQVLPGLDYKALKDPISYYEAGEEWQQTGETINEDLVQLFSYEASKKVDWSGPGRVSVPMEIVSEEARRRWPNRLKKDLEVGTRTTRFWDPDADAESAVVTKYGMKCFTGDRSFIDWSGLFGNEFVREFEADRIKRQTRDIYYSGKNYWIKAPRERWIPQIKHDVQELLSVRRGLSRSKPRNANYSEVEEALTLIREQNFVTGTFPFLYDGNDLISYKGKRYLNNSTVRLVPPAESNGEWAEGFPKIAEFLEKLFGNEQLPYFNAWLKVFYESAYKGHLNLGQALFIAGPPESGKTFLTTKLLSDLMGGHQGASLLIAQGDKYNAKHFDSPLWTIDDAEAASNKTTQEKYFQKVKQITANEEIECRGMYKEGVTIPWRGRLTVTMNDDGFSLNMLPSMDYSIEDKVNLFKVSKTDVHWPTLKESLSSELPHLAGYLLKHEIPARLVGTERFRVKQYHHPELLEEAKSGRPTSELELLLDRWRKSWFQPSNALERGWEGSAGELYKLANGHEKEMELCGIGNLRSLGWNLRNLASEVNWVKKVGKREWQILNPYWEERMRKTKPVYNSANEGPKQSEFLMEDDDRPF